MIEDIVILAAGKGSRMKSSTSKVLHKVGGLPMIRRVLTTASGFDNANLHLVIGHQGEQVKEECQDFSVNVVWQHNPQGTGDALKRVAPDLQATGAALTLYGDVPLIQLDTLKRMAAKATENTLILLTVTVKNPTGYGRIVRDHQDKVIAIVEQKDASEKEKEIREVNTGILLAPNAHLQAWLAQLTNHNAQGEYYLTDVIAMAAHDGIDIVTVQPTNEMEVAGVNDRVQLAALERELQRVQAMRLMRNGATLLDPQRIDVRGELITGQDVVIDVNCVFEGKVVLGEKVEIGPNCYLKDCTIGDGSIIKSHSLIEGSCIEKMCDIGPFARIRPGTHLLNKAKIGNFVETKQAHIGEGSKVNHLSYIGDTQMGSNVNVGAGTITCNYDGAYKHLTQVADNVFIGSNSALVAPVSVEEGATIAAGSTITQNVGKNQLAFARSRQVLKDNWSRPVKKKS